MFGFAASLIGEVLVFVTRWSMANSAEQNLLELAKSYNVVLFADWQW